MDNKADVGLMSRLRSKYRLSILNDQTYEEVVKLRVSWLNIIIALGGFALALILLVTLLIAFTPIRELIPGYPDGNTRKGYIANALKADSLEARMTEWQRYYETISIILNDGQPRAVNITPDSGHKYKNLDFSKSIEDSLLRQEIETENIYNIAELNNNGSSGTNIFFLPPIKGVVINHYNPHQNHYGIDLVAPPNEVVLAIADGTVILSSWALETGHTMAIQHKNNYISFYKHNSKLLKRQGERVKAGETIAIIGNSGELTTGPHLHFELWYDCSPLDPAEFIHF
ncbi:MAG: M23 family metallopeptidase [Bacteroidales bacterium]|nr:M23 family metallopeptidase [Bacteroidales bacterium]